MRCTITIEETRDGKLAIFANVPDGAEKTIAGALAKVLIEQSATIMNELLGESRQVEKVSTQ